MTGAGLQPGTPSSSLGEWGTTTTWWVQVVVVGWGGEGFDVRLVPDQVQGGGGGAGAGGHSALQ